MNTKNNMRHTNINKKKAAKNLCRCALRKHQHCISQTISVIRCPESPPSAVAMSMRFPYQCNQWSQGLTTNTVSISNIGCCKRACIAEWICQLQTTDGLHFAHDLSFSFRPYLPKEYVNDTILIDLGV